MKRATVVILVLVLSSLACSIQTSPAVATTPSASVVTVENTPTTPATTPEWTATVSRALVNVHSEPDGAVIAAVKSGDTVTILSCDGSWCKIEKPAGYVFRGCLSDNPERLGCEAK